MRISKERLALALAKAEMNPKQVSEKACLSYPTIKRALDGRNSKFATVGRIARALGVDVTELLEEV